jgi:hypothetical protein
VARIVGVYGVNYTPGGDHVWKWFGI